MVVNRQQQATLHGAHTRSQRLIVLPRERRFVISRLPIRRIGIKEGVRPVISGQTVLPPFMLDIHPAQPFLSCLNLMAHIGRVEGAAGGGRAEMLLVGSAAEGRVLQEEKSAPPVEYPSGNLPA